MLSARPALLNAGVAGAAGLLAGGTNGPWVGLGLSGLRDEHALKQAPSTIEIQNRRSMN